MNYKDEGVVTELIHELLRLIGPAGKKGASRKEVVRGARDNYKDRISSAFANACYRKKLVRVDTGKSGVARYVLSPEWQELYKQFDQLKVVVVETQSGKKKKPAAEVRPAPEPELSVNVSPEANAFADYATNLIAQNAEYRATLLNIYNTIGKLLNPTNRSN